MLHPRSGLMSEQNFSAAVKSLIINIVEFIALDVKHKRGRKYKRISDDLPYKSNRLKIRLPLK